MPVYILTVELRSPDGQVADAMQAPFLVLEPGEDNEDAIEDLQEAARQLEQEAAELSQEAGERQQRHRRWWL